MLQIGPRTSGLKRFRSWFRGSKRLLSLARSATLQKDGTRVRVAVNPTRQTQRRYTYLVLGFGFRFSYLEVHYL